MRDSGRPRSIESDPLVSVVIPARDAAAHIAKAVESVLAQSYPRVECIVVDDGSTDETREIAATRGERVRVLDGGGVGVAAARNLGAGSATGGLLSFLDADDEWEVQRTERLLEELRRTGADAVICASRVISAGGTGDNTIRLRPLPPDLSSLLRWDGSVVSTSSNLLIKRDVFDAVGAFDPRLSTAADWELLIRLVSQTRLVYVDEPLVRYRWHERNMSRDLDLTERDLAHAYEIALARMGEDLPVSRRRATAGFHRMLAAANWRFGRRGRSLAHAASAVIRDPRLLGEAGRFIQPRSRLTPEARGSWHPRK
jgi:glycosyltransferase involved in cell wall biosynthesis